MTDSTPADPDDCLGLPGWVYSNARFFAAERERVLAPSWQVVCHLNDIPRTGESVEFGGRRFTVLEMDRNRIARVRVEKIPVAGTSSG